MQVWLLEQQFGLSGQFRVLDLGCEKGYTGRYIRAAFPNAHITGVDIWEPYIRQLQGLAANGERAYDVLHLEDALAHAQAHAHSYDAVVAAEIIEHFDEDKGHEVLKALAPVQTRIITAPYGFVAQGAMDKNEYQIHRSGWLPEDLAPYKYELFAHMPNDFLAVYYGGKFGGWRNTGG